MLMILVSAGELSWTGLGLGGLGQGLDKKQAPQDMAHLWKPSKKRTKNVTFVTIGSPPLI